MYQFPRPQRRTPHLLIVAPRGGLDVRKGLGCDRIEPHALKVAVRAELDRLLRRRVGGDHFGVPEHAFSAAVLEPHQGRNDGCDLGHRAGKLQKRNKQMSEFGSERVTRDVLAIIFTTVQDQGDH